MYCKVQVHAFSAHPDLPQYYTWYVSGISGMGIHLLSATYSHAVSTVARGIVEAIKFPMLLRHMYKLQVKSCSKLSWL